MCTVENKQFSMYTGMVDYDEVTMCGSRGGDSLLEVLQPGKASLRGR